MKKYREYMDSVRASDTLHQRLVGLEASGKRPVPWKKYGTMAAALALVCGLGVWGLAKSGGWDALAANFRPDATLTPEIAVEPVPDIAIVEPGDVTEPGQKTIGGYEVISGSGENAIATYYILPYIDYGETGGISKAAQTAADWDIPSGASRRYLTQNEMITLMGGVDATDTHLDWSGYTLTGWTAWNEDGSFWGSYVYGYQGPLDHFEFAVTAGHLPPTCIAYPESVTQEVRGLTVTADGYDSVATPSGGVDGSNRRVSFMKDNYGYRFDITGSSRALTEERVSRLVCHVADRGLGLYSVDGTADVCYPEDGTYVCVYCGHVFPTGTTHNHAFIGADATYTCDLCGNTFPVGTAHTHEICVLPPVSVSDAPDVPFLTCPDCGQTIPAGAGHYCVGGKYTCPICKTGALHDHKEIAPVESADPGGTHTCTICGEVLPIDVEHSHGAETCPDCGEIYAEGTAHHCAGGTYTCPDCGQTVQNGDAHSHSSHSSDHHGDSHH